MLKNKAGQYWRVFAFNRSTNEPVLGDAANITAKISIDGAATVALADTNPTETEDGYYVFDLTQNETAGNQLDLYPESASSGVQVIGIPGSQITFSSTTAASGTPLVTSQNKITKTPKYAAIRPKRADGTDYQKWELLVYPIPSADMTVDFRYAVNPPPLSDDNPYPVGGRQHAETLLQSCLAVAEDREKGGPGPAQAKFVQRLAASIHVDKQFTRSTEEGTTWLNDAEGGVGNSVRSLVGLHMGFGQNHKAWTESQIQQVEEAMRQGLRRFYVPPPVPGQRYGHQWSFLIPLQTLNLKADKSEYELPEDFGMLDSPMTYAPGENTIYPPVVVTGEHHVRRLQQSTTQADGRPTHVAIRVKAGIQEGGTRYEAVFWPTPDDSYALDYRYRVMPSKDVTVIHGGDAHFQTILEACRAAADSLTGKQRSPHEKAFLERLSASVSYDQMLQAPAQMGYNRDGSDAGMTDEDFHRFGYGENAVTYNGQTF